MDSTHKLVSDETFTTFHKITYISFDTGPRILHLHNLGHPFSLAGHIYILYIVSLSMFICSRETTWRVGNVP